MGGVGSRAQVRWWGVVMSCFLGVSRCHVFWGVSRRHGFLGWPDVMVFLGWPDAMVFSGWPDIIVVAIGLGLSLRGLGFSMGL